MLNMNEELTTTEAAPLVHDGVPAYTTPVQLHPDYTPEKAQRACAKQWAGLLGTLTFMAVMFPVLFRELPPPDVLIVSLMGVAIMATIGYQIGYIWGSPIIRRVHYSKAVAVTPSSNEVTPSIEEEEEEAIPLPEKAVTQTPEPRAAETVTIKDDVAPVAENEQV